MEQWGEGTQSLLRVEENLFLGVGVFSGDADSSKLEEGGEGEILGAILTTLNIDQEVDLTQGPEVDQGQKVVQGLEVGQEVVQGPEVGRGQDIDLGQDPGPNTDQDLQRIDHLKVNLPTKRGVTGPHP